MSLFEKIVICLVVLYVIGFLPSILVIGEDDGFREKISSGALRTLLWPITVPRIMFDVLRAGRHPYTGP
jgi:hypothetical protein